jgi:chaperonin GroEL
MARETVKVKTASKVIVHNHDQLRDKVIHTVGIASKIVGDTLGPNGKLALIERQENLPVYTTKDGITVFDAIAFSDSTMQCILEAARSSSSKTNDAAGDGTTTATILADALIRHGFEYVDAHPEASVQAIMRDIESAFNKIITPFIRNQSVKVDLQNANDLLYKVANIATNNDHEMAKAVIEAFDLVGHNGNITIEEISGVDGFQVEKIEGFNIAKGFEESCGKFVEEFINDRGNLRTILDRPKFILLNGKINEPSVLIPILNKILVGTGLADDGVTDRKSAFSPNIVIVAHQFSDQVLAFFAQNFKNPNCLNLFPLRTPISQQSNSQQHFLLDLAAFTGATIFDPQTRPLENAELEDLGIDSMNQIQFYRYRSVLLGNPDEAVLMMRAEELEQQVKQPESQLDAVLTQERLSLLTGGIARVKVLGSSETELKEKRHRVEDAVCAIKGAIREGVLPGCSKTLLTLSYALKQNQKITESVREILGKAFEYPFKRILANGGLKDAEVKKIYNKLMDENKEFFYTYDALNRKYGNAIDIGVVDSASAVYESVKNSISVAKMLMALSSTIVFKRDWDADNEAGKEYDEQRAAIETAIAERKQEDFQPSIY